MKSIFTFYYHLQEKSTAESIKSGAKTVGSYLQLGWSKLKSGVSKANTKFKEAEVFSRIELLFRSGEKPSKLLTE